MLTEIDGTYEPFLDRALNELNPILSESIPKEFTKKEMIYSS